MKPKKWFSLVKPTYSFCVNFYNKNTSFPQQRHKSPEKSKHPETSRLQRKIARLWHTAKSSSWWIWTTGWTMALPIIPRPPGMEKILRSEWIFCFTPVSQKERVGFFLLGAYSNLKMLKKMSIILFFFCCECFWHVLTNFHTWWKPRHVITGKLAVVNPPRSPEYDLEKKRRFRSQAGNLVIGNAADDSINIYI